MKVMENLGQDVLGRLLDWRFPNSQPDRRRDTQPSSHAAVVDILACMAIDCPDPGVLARFCGAMPDRKIDVSADRASACSEDGQCIAFHRVADYMPPTWPAQADAPRHAR
ncbi:hypothetical protein AB0G04_11770 [Actinoplanes sp. NPDC023801]|uniref:hypothetical protein n=1 Tax=Actinoplanes sp. NPDC023801 TaxID=3154595 RepID=UPI0033DCB05E